MSKGTTHTTWAPPPPVASTAGVSPGRRASKGAHVTRIRAERALEHLASGLGYRQTVAELVREFAVSTRTGERDVRRAQQLLLEEHAAERPSRRAKLEARLERLSRAAEEVGDYGSAIRAVSVLGKWSGFEELQINSSADELTERVLSMTPQEREKRIAELMAKRAAATPPPAPDAPERPGPPPRDRSPAFDPRRYARGPR